MHSIIQWLEVHMMTCPYKAMSRIDCPGCGMQRSLIELLKGNLAGSFYLYPALIPTILTLGLTGLHLTFKFKDGANYIKYAFIITMGIIIISYIFKMLR